MINQLSEEQIINIRRSIDIVEVISNYIPLISKGKNYFGVCPFHDDHSPSMSVSKEKQMYKCFSCGASGNVFKFLMDYENIGFVEAVKIVADKGGIVLNINTTKTINKKDDYYYDVYDLAAKFYQNNINTTLGLEAKEYLKQRKLDNNIIKEFGIGLSLKNTEMLTKLLLKKGYKKDALIKSGLINDGNNLHDVYYNRIIFPIWDLNGQVIGFSGRIYNSNDSSKYINTKETDVFKKGEILYNYHRAKKEARAIGQVIIVEGFMDVIRLDTIGIKNVVATMGTSFTNYQALNIKKMAKEIILCYDGDDAGAKATFSTANILNSNGVMPKIIRLEEQLDPDEYIKKYGKERFILKIENSINIMDFKLSYLKNNKDLNSNQDIAEYVNQVLTEVSKIDDEVLKELTLKKLCEESNLDIEFLKKQLLDKHKIEEKIPILPKKNIRKLNKYEKAEQNLVYYMLNSVDVILLYQKHITYLPTEEYRSLAREIIYFYKINKTVAVADLMTMLSNDEENYKVLNDILSLNLKDEFKTEEIMDYIKTINECNVLYECNKLTDLIKQEIDPMKKAAIAQDIVNLKKKLG